MIPVAQHVKNIERMRVHKDGDSYFVAFDNFVNLQESPAFFVDDERILGVFEKIHKNPLAHLTHGELCYLSERLTKQEEQCNGNKDNKGAL